MIILFKCFNLNFFFFLFSGGNRCMACNDNYAGDSSFSEAETSAVANIFDKFFPISMVFSLYSFGQMWLLPYACCSSNPHGLSEMVRRNLMISSFFFFLVYVILFFNCLYFCYLCFVFSLLSFLSRMKFYHLRKKKTHSSLVPTDQL